MGFNDMSTGTKGHRNSLSLYTYHICREGNPAYQILQLSEVSPTQAVQLLHNLRSLIKRYPRVDPVIRDFSEFENAH